METRNIHKDASWYASYDNSEQGRALIECQSRKIQQLTDIINRIGGEIELTEDPIEQKPERVLQSIKALISNIPEIQYVEPNGWFRWVG